MKTFLHIVVVTICFLMWLALVTVILLVLSTACHDLVSAVPVKGIKSE